VTRAYERSVLAKERPPRAAKPARQVQQVQRADSPVGQLQRSAGNTAVAQLFGVQRAGDPAIAKALDEVKLVSQTITKSTRLQPWLMFETMPWNDEPGVKKKLYQATKAAYGKVAKAEGTLAKAREFDARTPKPKKRPKGIPTVAKAEAGLATARAAVDTKMTELKDFVKSKLGSSKNPRTADLQNRKTAAKAEVKRLDKALAKASRGKKPDAALVATLTTQRDAAKAAIGAADQLLTSRIATLKTEIDAADWSPKEVAKQRYVFEVDGIRATLGDSIDAYATTTARGMDGDAQKITGGGPTVAELLAKDATIGKSAKKILSIISGFEGNFSTINTYDVADVTFGMVQWTTGSGGVGDLIKAMTVMKAMAPAAFATRLTRFGIDVDPARGLVITRPDGTVLNGEPAAKALQGDPKLTAVLAAAGTDPALQAGELNAAYEIEVKAALRATLAVTVPAHDKQPKTTVKVPLSSVFTSEFGAGVLANHTVHGGFPKKKLQGAISAYATGHRPDLAKLGDWAKGAEADLITAISTGLDKPRIDKMSADLNHSPGSYE
jgi:hypothetical protein